LKLIPSDELTFALWKTEQPGRIVLKDLPADAAIYSGKDWEVKMQSYTGRDVMLGIEAFGEARAFPLSLVIREKLVRDRVGSEPVILLVGSDGQSVRAFRETIPAARIHPASSDDSVLEFFLLTPFRKAVSLPKCCPWKFNYLRQIVDQRPGCAVIFSHRGPRKMKKRFMALSISLPFIRRVSRTPSGWKPGSELK
jgi:hypothetical protein